MLKIGCCMDVRSGVLPLTYDLFWQLVRSQKTVRLIKEVRNGNLDKKRNLPAITWHASFSDGKRHEDSAVPSGVFMLDVDHVDDPRGLWSTVADRVQELDILVAHVTPSGRGLRIVALCQPQFDTIAQNQRWMADQLKTEYDACCKDWARLSFLCTESDILYTRDHFLDVEPKKVINLPRPLPRRGEGDENANQDPNPKSNPNADQTLPLEGEGRERVSGVGGLDYSRIIPAFFQLENSSYPDIVEGVRNDTIFGVCAKYLRYCCDHNAAKMKALLFPQYSFGLSEEEVNSIIRSALARERGLTPKVVKKILAASVSNSEEEDNSYQEGVRVINEMYGMEDPTDDEPAGWMGLSGMYPSVADCIVEDMMMPKLPRFVETLLKVCPPGHKFVTLGCASPAVMTLLTGITCQFLSKRPSRLNGWAHLDGLPAAGKESIVAPIKLLLTPIKEQDDRNREAINEAIRQRDIKRNQETVDPIPELPMRILPPNTTRNGHIDNMVKAKGAHTYTLATELQSLNTHGAGYYDREDFERLMFDNGEVGTVTKMDTSQKQMTPCCWNVTTSSTRDQTVAHWKNVTNGAVTRVMFLLMPDTTFTEMPQYVQYTPEDRAYVVRAARIMTEMKGLVETPRLSRAMAAWLHDVLEEARQEKNTIRGILRKRSADIAFYFGVVIHLCWAVQQVMDEEDALERKGEKLRQQLQEAQQQNDSERLAEVENALIALQQERATWQATRLDLSRFSEHKASADLAVYAANYTLNTQYDLFGRKMKQQLTSSYEGVQKVTDRQDCRLSRLPKTPFTVEQLIDIFPEMNNGSIRKMIARWLGAQLVVKVGTKDRIAQYALNS